MPHSDQLYNRIGTLLYCFILYKKLEEGDPIVPNDFIIRTASIEVPDNFNTFDYLKAIRYTKKKIVTELYHVFLHYFESKNTGEYTFKYIHKFNGMEQHITITILFEDLKYFITDINDNINPDQKYGYDFEKTHEIERPIFFD